MAQLQFSDEQIQDLAVLRDTPLEVFANAADRLNHADKLILRPEELLKVVETALDGRVDLANRLLRQCLSLNGLMRQTGLSIDEIEAGIRSALSAHWSPDQMATWDAAARAFGKFLRNEQFRLVTKAIELSYDYANLYRKGRIIADIRPLFSDDATSVVGSVVSYTLRLRFDRSDGDQELSIAMDQRDVEELSLQCARAIQKGRTARDLMLQHRQIPTIITGDKVPAE